MIYFLAEAGFKLEDVVLPVCPSWERVHISPMEEENQFRSYGERGDKGTIIGRT